MRMRTNQECLKHRKSTISVYHAISNNIHTYNLGFIYRRKSFSGYSYYSADCYGRFPSINNKKIRSKITGTMHTYTSKKRIKRQIN